MKTAPPPALVTHTIVVPLLPPPPLPPGHSRHYGVAWKLRVRYRDLVAAACRAAGVPVAVKRRAVHLTLQTPAADFDLNAARAAVHAALLSCGRLRHDEPLQVLNSVHLELGAKPGTIITLEELA